MPEIENKISLGNLWSIGVTLVTVISAFVWLQAAGTQNSEDIRDHEARIRVMESTLSTRLTRMEAQLDAIERAVRSGQKP